MPTTTGIGGGFSGGGNLGLYQPPPFDRGYKPLPGPGDLYDPRTGTYRPMPAQGSIQPYEQAPQGGDSLMALQGASSRAPSGVSSYGAPSVETPQQKADREQAIWNAQFT